MPDCSIVFRADGNAQIGMGHFVRSLALADMLKNRFHCVFASRQPRVQQQRQIDAVCSQRLDLPEDDAHFDAFEAQLTGREIVVLDNYYYDTAYQKRIKNKGCKVVCIDDIHRFPFEADVVINHAEGINPGNYQLSEHSRLLHGYNYALLRKPFLDSLQAGKPTVEKQYDCLLMMGATDPLGLIPRLLDQLREAGIGKQKPIAVAGGQKQPENRQHVAYFEQLDAASMVQLMQASAFGVLPASTLVLEACATRLPIVSGYFADNQHECYKGLIDSNLAVGVGNFETLKQDRLEAALQQIAKPEVRQRLQQQQERKLDRNIPQRYQQLFQQLCH